MKLVNHSKMSDEKIKEIFYSCAKPLGISAMKVVIEKRLTRMRGHTGYSVNRSKEVHIEIKDDKNDTAIYPRFVDHSKRPRFYTTDN